MTMFNSESARWEVIRVLTTSGQFVRYDISVLKARYGDWIAWEKYGGSEPTPVSEK